MRKLFRKSQERISEVIKDEIRHNEINDTKVVVYVKKNIPKQAPYTMFYQEVNLQLIKLLKPNACKVLMYLMAKIGYDNTIGVDQKTIQEELEYKSVTSVKMALSELKELNIILTTKDVQDKKRNVYIINPYQSWKGKVTNRIQAIVELGKESGIQLELPFWDNPKLPF